ncbi:MAG: ABC transporter permease [SAR324 cluster bacterium]|nr:ABC transporter permease [SAR324 cluster bacterium]
MLNMFRALWQYRNFVLSSVKNELVTRFARSKWGGFWIVINPLSQVLIYALILSNILAAKLPGIDDKYGYAIYLMAGLLAWSLFIELISRGVTLFLEQGNLMKKMSFPRVTLPSILLGSCLLNNFMLFIAMIGIFGILGQALTFQLLWVFPLTIILATLSLSLGLILGVLNVFLRDIGQIVPIVLQVWFWGTPIVYPVSIIPERFHYLMNFNPLYHIVLAYHQVLVYGAAPALEGVMITFAGSVILLGFALFLFRQSSAEMVDVL